MRKKMSDLISRADAIAVIRKNHYRLYGHGMTEDALVYDLGKLPSADAVEVVRCKDCKHYESDGGALMICTLNDMIVDDECYCWFGERREE